MHICFLGLKAYRGCMAWPIMFIHASYDRIFSRIVDTGFLKSQGSIFQVFEHKVQTKMFQYYKDGNIKRKLVP